MHILRMTVGVREKQNQVHMNAGKTACEISRAPKPAQALTRAQETAGTQDGLYDREPLNSYL